jgi:predicted amidohydrolase
MASCRIALANLPLPATPADSVPAAERAIAEAGSAGADVVCFPECFVPGYRRPGHHRPPADAAFLEQAWSAVALAAGRANVCALIGTERVTPEGLVVSTLVVNRDGSRAGFHDKLQIDPSEEAIYVAARTGRRLFRSGALTFGIAVCHEGWRYPETVRWAAQRGARIVFHPHYHWPEPGGYRATSFADPANTFHEKAMLCRAAENTIYFASVNYASEGSPTTSAVVRPDGTLLAWQPYGRAGLLVMDLDLSEATGLLASRCRADEYSTTADTNLALTANPLER